MNIWTTAADLLRSPVAHQEIPGLLSGMGVINTVAVFAYSNALNRVAGIKYRRRAAIAFIAAWAATALVVLAYVLNGYLGWQSGILVDIGLLLWILSFPAVLVLIYLGARDAVGTGRSWYERDPGLENRFAMADFGVEAIDCVIRRALQFGRRVNYPVLLIHDMDSPGLAVVARFVQSGLAANEAVIYLTFSRPFDTIRRQIARGLADPERLRDVWILDCYSRVYMPEVVHGNNDRVCFADPRDPSDVYAKYMTVLWHCRGRHASVRSVYETLSDFIKIADADLVMHYLRRVVVLEENRHIRALYLFWDSAIQGVVDQKYLRWFFSTTVEMARTGRMTPATGISVTIERLFRDPVQLQVGADLAFDEAALFQIGRTRVDTLAPLVVALAYQPVPYRFLPELEGPDRSRHLVNFLFFMVAIDHDTHRPMLRYEAELNGQFRHGSDLLYALAQQAKRADPTLFLPDRMAAIDDAEVARLFTAPDGCAPADLIGRAQLFRATARQLSAQYDGDAVVLLERAQGRLGGNGGLFARLSAFEAYEDPLGKKANLLAKILVREDQFHPRDPEAMDIAVDHVVMTMALRGGLVVCKDATVAEALATGALLDGYQVAVLRDVTRQALRALAETSGVPLDRIDDLVWSYGRKALRRATPLDHEAAVHGELDARVNLAALPRFVAALNGLDDGADPAWRHIRRVAGPFTRYY